MITFKCLKKTSGILWDLVKIISMLSGLINTIVLNICSLGLITPSSVCHLRTEFWLAVSFGDFSPIGWNDTKIFDPKDILVDPARMSLGYSGSHAGSTKKSLKCPRGMKKTRRLLQYAPKRCVLQYNIISKNDTEGTKCPWATWASAAMISANRKIVTKWHSQSALTSAQA